MSNKPAFSTGLAKITDTFAPMIERQLTGNGVSMDQYARQCVVNAISSINTVLDSKGIDWNDEQLDKNNITQILLNVAALKLNAAASPREVYFQLRNVSIKTRDKGQEVTIWKKQIEMGVEGDGNDAILARFGRDVEKVGQFWLVRDKDEFEYPVYTGFDVEPPKWRPTGQGEVIRIVYPILKTDGTVEYHIAEREDVSRNLIAHINNNMMNETFGICKDRYNATPEQRKKIAAKKKEILDKAKELGLASLDSEELQQWISPAWTEHQSREQMLIRKMRNNVVKRIPKDFGSAFIEMVHDEATDIEYTEIRQEIAKNANGEVIDIEIDNKEENVEIPQETIQEEQSKETSQSEEPSTNEQIQADQEQMSFAPTGTGPDF